MTDRRERYVPIPGLTAGSKSRQVVTGGWDGGIPRGVGGGDVVVGWGGGGGAHRRGPSQSVK